MLNAFTDKLLQPLIQASQLTQRVGSYWGIVIPIIPDLLAA